VNYEDAKEHYKEQIDFRVNDGWLYEHAKNYALLSSVFARGTMARALEKRDARFAASSYALADALNSRVKKVFEGGKFESSQDHAGRYYRNLTGMQRLATCVFAKLNSLSVFAKLNSNARYGKPCSELILQTKLIHYYTKNSRGTILPQPHTGFGSLALDYEKWEKLEKPDTTGFTGLTTCAFICPSRNTDNFDDHGWKAQVKKGEFASVSSDIVAFDSREVDDHGFHHGIDIGDKEKFAAYPPYTLFRLQTTFKPGEWTAPGGRRPNCRLLLVSATYRFPDETDNGGQSHKMCENSATLNYGSRFTFIQGLTDILDKPTLTMEQEWTRSTRWTDRNNNEYWSVSEWKYVNGPAEPADYTATINQWRDKDNAGKTPKVFMDLVNRDIENHFRDKTNDSHLITQDEVLAVRLYTGPGYQPINDFLRQISHLSGHMRRALAKSPALTFAATVGHICHAIRKLSVITPETELEKSLYRGVRGELPHTFWVKDSQGMVCAVDGGFLSTSKNKEIVFSYMCKGLNVLWVVKPKPESDAAFHRGADVSKLSQFATEEEVLFPPCTMLEVDRERARSQAMVSAVGHVAENLCCSPAAARPPRAPTPGTGEPSLNSANTSGDRSLAHTQTLSISHGGGPGRGDVESGTPNTSGSACAEHVQRAKDMGLRVEAGKEERDKYFVCLTVTPSFV